ncbi:M20 family metallopeptidase [Bordetella petrii]|uniref:M20 family metallopeptidase n=1 Tax=Bordetella petrii TaxID=94624 RepID=A0ABT7W869_9BORD|nr:M20 family metallopeptidase [Bordetella petrii]MDM9561391.1 M20 family metallopeptidase [Bordetella petrii]
MTRSEAISSAVQQFDDGRFLATLARRIAYQTESEEPAQAAAQHAYLREELAPLLQRLGFSLTIHPNPAGVDLPLLVAQRIEDPDLPTVLMYGHADVVRGNAARWSAGRDPWRLQVEGDRWYGRGTADNKGQHSINLAALESVMAARAGRLGFNAKLLIETGEEAGSPGLAAFCASHRPALAADLFLASDGPRLAAERPTLFMGSRGAVNFELSVHLRERAYHSGNWGGLLANPAILLAHALASLVDARGRIAVDALRPPAMPPQIRQALAGLPVGGGIDDPDVDQDWGEPGLGPAEQVFGWNSLDVLTLSAGDAAKPVNAIQPRASAWCQLRFVVGTDWRGLQQHVRDHLDRHGFPMVQVRLGAQAAATRLLPDHPWVQWAAQSLRQTTGRDAVLLPNLGGSLPNDIFADQLGLPTVWVPHSYPACAQHAPDEHLLGSVAREGLAVMAGLYWDLGEAGRRPAPRR